MAETISGDRTAPQRKAVLPQVVSIARVQLSDQEGAAFAGAVRYYEPPSSAFPNGAVHTTASADPVDRSQVTIHLLPPCPGDCNRAWRKAQANPDLRGAAQIEPIAGRPVWCTECQGEIRSAVRRLPDLATDLWARGHYSPDRRTVDPAHWLRVPVPTSDPARLHPWTNIDLRPRSSYERDRAGVPMTDLDEGRLSVVRAERGSGAPGSPNLSPSWAACEEIIAWAGQVEDRARARLGQAGRHGSWWAGSAEGRAHYLSSSVLWILARSDVWALPESHEWGRQVLRIAKQAEKLAGLDELIHHLGACPTCDRKALVRIDGDDVVRCRACKKSWTEDEWHWMVRVAAAAAKEDKKA